MSGTGSAVRSPSGAAAGGTRCARVLAYGTAVPAVLLAAWMVASLPLLLLGAFRPLPAVALFAVIAVAGVRVALGALRDRAASWGVVPIWVVVAVLAVVVAFVVLEFFTSADGVVVRRDPQTYSVIATWLSGHGQLPIDVHASAFGGTDPGLRFATQGFYTGDGAVVPQFMSGFPATLAIGGWLAGIAGVLHMGAVLGGLAVLAFAGLVARLVGPRWAPLGALGLALTGPQLHAARAAFSEPAAQLVLIGGLVLLVDALAAADRVVGVAPGDAPVVTPAHRRAVALAGMVLGAVMLVRIDALSQLVPLVPFVAWLAYRRSTLARPLALGVGVGVAFAALDGLVLSRHYLAAIAGSLAEAVGGAALVIAASIVAVRVLPRRPLVFGRWPAPVAACAVVAGGLAFAVRPLLQTTRTNPASGGAQVVAQAQAELGLDIDGSRNYYEESLRWVSWYVGWGALALAVVGAAWLVWRAVQGSHTSPAARGWPPVLLVLLGASALVLWRPSITPDHPWADRRLVPAVIPAVVLFAVAAGGLALERLRLWTQRVGAGAGSRRPAGSRAAAGSRAVQGLLVLAVAAIVLVPAALASAPLAGARTEQGEVAMVRQICANLAPGDVVLTLGDRARAELTGTLRVMCPVPTAQVVNGDEAATVARVADKVAAAGGRAVVLAAARADLALVGLDWGAPAVQLDTHEDERTLVSRPDKLGRLTFDLWLGYPATR